jgi:tetratricopeptide (TPR) repeat protein
VKRRKEIHEKIGEAIEALYLERLEEHYELLAYHSVRSKDKVKALEYLNLANQKAVKTNALEEAKTYFDQAMELLDTLPDTKENQQKRISLLVNQTNVFMLLLKASEYHGILRRFEHLAISLDDPGLKGAFFARLAFNDFGFGSFHKAIQTLRTAAEVCEAGGNVEDAGFAYLWLAWCHQFMGDFDRALALKQQVLGKLREKFSLVVYVRMLCCSSVAFACLGRWDEALEEARQGLKVAEEYSDNSLISFSALQLVNTYAWKRDIKKAVEYAEMALQKAPTPADKLWAQSYLAWVWCLAGDPCKGVNILEKSVEIYRDGPYIPMALPAMFRLIEAYVLVGKYTEALQMAKELLELAERCGSRPHIGLGHYYLGEIALQINPNEADLHFEKGISLAQETKAEHQLSLAYSGMGRYHKHQGNTAQAREYLTKALEILERLGTLIEPDKVRNELAGLGD